MFRSYSKTNQYLPHFKHLKTEAEVAEIKRMIDLTPIREYDRELIKHALDDGDVIILADDCIRVKQGADDMVYVFR